MATYLEMINAVLVKLREGTVSTAPENTLSSLVAQFVTDAKREVEDAWDWTGLRTETTITCVSGTSQYTLNGSNQRTKVLQALNNTEDTILAMVHSGVYMRWIHLGNTTPESPTHYRMRGWNSSGELLVQTYPTPNSADILTFELVVPQPDPPSNITVVTVPHWPIVQRAWAMAVSERGEDGGQSFDEIMAKYSQDLADAISIDRSRTANELDWVVV